MLHPGIVDRDAGQRGGAVLSLAGAYAPQSRFGSRVPLFAQRRPSGRADLVRAANTVRVTTSGVAEYTLLLSPQMFDFGRPITVVTNERVSFNRIVTPSVATLLKWAALDNDRTMLFGAELHIRVEQ